MSRSALARLLSPRSLAVIGGREAAEVIRQCERIGFQGEIWPVNPKRPEVAGRKSFASLADLPGVPDASFIAVPREVTIESVATLAKMGAGGAVCYASGFAEVGGDGINAQARLVAASGEMALLGPNCYGLLNYLDGAALWPDQHGGLAVQRGVAIITQSGNIGLNLTMQARSLPLAYLISAGNKAKGDLGEMIDTLLDDERVTAIGLHIEGLDDIERFSKAALRALDQGVPLVAIKTGRSEAGAALTMSHTSSLAGSDQLFDALFARFGIGRTKDVGTFLETLKLLHVHGPLSSRTVSSMSCSGGEAGLVADLASDAGLPTPPLTKDAEAKLFEALGPKVPLANPLDYHTYIWGDLEASTATFSAMLGAGYGINLLILDFPRGDRCDASSWDVTLQAFENAQKATGAKAALVASMPESLPESVGQRMIASGIAPMQGLSECMEAIRIAADIGAVRAREREAPLKRASSVEVESAHMLDEPTGKATLKSFGLTVPKGEVVAIADAAQAAERIGFPVVVKAVSDTIAHKTEAGAVKLNLKSASEVEMAAKAMAHLSDRVLVEAMQSGIVAEMIIGVTRDPLFGPTLTFGSGGILVELLKDAASLLLPTTREAVEDAFDQLKLAHLVEGFRGRAKGDRQAAIDAIMAVASYAERERDMLVELDVNPVLILEQGAVAVDAMIRKARA
ncbi:MAG: acetate--CoA ligase family protein [Hyphomicrobiales bacterium]|nr:acetate--CoA ligase family protein [Hyphomicrobiales bacterium]